MRVITEKPLQQFAARFRDARRPLDAWLRIVQDAQWRNITEVRRSFASADAATVRSGRTVTIFNIAGNKYRLITAIHYNRQRVFVLRVLTHAEYDRDVWKREL